MARMQLEAQGFRTFLPRYAKTTQRRWNIAWRH